MLYDKKTILFLIIVFIFFESNCKMNFHFKLIDFPLYRVFNALKGKVISKHKPSPYEYYNSEYYCDRSNRSDSFATDVSDNTCYMESDVEEEGVLSARYYGKRNNIRLSEKMIECCCNSIKLISELFPELKEIKCKYGGKIKKLSVEDCLISVVNSFVKRDLFSAKIYFFSLINLIYNETNLISIDIRLKQPLQVALFDLALEVGLLDQALKHIFFYC